MCAEAWIFLALSLLDARHPATVTHTGDGRIELVDERGARHPPGPLRPGRYDVLATFPGRNERLAGRVDLGDRESLTVRCVTGFYKCAVVM